jgi:starch-binding outer membrane protein SusE/F
MKNIIKKSIIALAILALGSCNVEDNNTTAIATPSGEPKLVSPSSGNSYVLSKQNADKVIATFVWDFSNNGIDSPATYSIEVAKSGAKFDNAKVVASSQNKFIAVTNKQLNDALGETKSFPAFFENEAEVRIKSSLGNGANAVVQYSNAIKIKVTPYRLPAATSLWLVGAATPGGWTWAGDAETEFPLISPGVYEVNITLKNDNTFRVFLGNNGGDSWDLGSRNYPWYLDNGYTISSELVNANDGDSNFKYTGPTGVRVFKIDENAKTITLN